MNKDDNLDAFGSVQIDKISPENAGRGSTSGFAFIFLKNLFFSN